MTARATHVQPHECHRAIDMITEWPCYPPGPPLPVFLVYSTVYTLTSSNLSLRGVLSLTPAKRIPDA